MSTKQNTVDQTQTIITLIRRGDSVDKISAMLGVKKEEVERILDWYVTKFMCA